MPASPKNRIDYFNGVMSCGDRMTQSEFHSLYEQCGDDFHAQLIDGTVFVREPLGSYHAKYHSKIDNVLGTYEAATPGLEVCSGATVIMSTKDEVEPDLLLRILPEYKGRSIEVKKTKGVHFIQGTPELIVEIAHTTRSIDLNLKQERYQSAGVIEYIVLCLEPAELHWFDLRRERRITGDSESIFRSRAFPGLWIHGRALISKDGRTLLSTLNQGIATPEHAKFVEKLKAARK